MSTKLLNCREGIKGSFWKTDMILKAGFMEISGDVSLLGLLDLPNAFMHVKIVLG